MFRLALFVIAVLLCAPLATHTALAQSDVLPAVDANGVMAPLTVDQLDAQERTTYATLSEDDAQRYLHTRGYLRYARLVVAGELPPLELPRLPPRANWGRHLLSESERTNILDVALGMKYVARQEELRRQ